MKPVHQTLFGAPDGPNELIGNCYPSCLATLLDVDLAEVPHVYQLHAVDDDALQATLNWLHGRGYTTLCYDWAPWVQRYFPGALVIVSGKSPRGEFQHAVVGEITETGWRLIHDPHPNGSGIDGEPKSIEVLVPMLKMPANDNGQASEAAA